jgi:hypothetical protein
LVAFQVPFKTRTGAGGVFSLQEVSKDKSAKNANMEYRAVFFIFFEGGL